MFFKICLYKDIHDIFQLNRFMICKTDSKIWKNATSESQSKHFSLMFVNYIFFCHLFSLISLSLSLPKVLFSLYFVTVIYFKHYPSYGIDLTVCWKVLSSTRKEKSSEACQGRARFQQHRDASCHQVSFSWKARGRRKFVPFWQKH